VTKSEDAFETPVGLPPGATLPAAAQPAWLAYRDMQASKEAHFAALAEAQAAPDRGAVRLARTAHRDGLLANHDTAVKTFAHAMQALAARDAAAHRALIALIARLNADVGGPGGD